MALKPGRVGVAPDQVDDFGKVKSDATSGYTKQEADAKFETQTAAAAALAEKQPIQLSVPIELLSGSVLTVEDALNGLNDDFNDSVAIHETQAGNIIEGATTNTNVIMKRGSVVSCDISLAGVTTAAETVLGTIPVGFRPSVITRLLSASGKGLRVQPTGEIQTAAVLSNEYVSFHTVWIIE